MFERLTERTRTLWTELSHGLRRRLCGLAGACETWRHELIPFFYFLAVFAALFSYGAVFWPRFYLFGLIDGLMFIAFATYVADTMRSALQSSDRVGLGLAQTLAVFLYAVPNELLRLTSSR